MYLWSAKNDTAGGGRDSSRLHIIPRWGCLFYSHAMARMRTVYNIIPLSCAWQCTLCRLRATVLSRFPSPLFPPGLPLFPSLPHTYLLCLSTYFSSVRLPDSPTCGSSWCCRYTGPSLVEAIDNFPASSRPLAKAQRVVISDA